ncbi:MAG: 16S rRNA (cytosine(967)-C(5))-methyltransferase RsmB [Clostridia bacterium]|nr:16S rRNA (cytosine(967)-C(5))-methyltransferase RsmB [Clostridia bacterium]
MQENARQCAVEALMRLHGKQGFSNKVVDSFLKKHALSSEDKTFFTKLVYGVEERKLTIDYFLNKASKMPLRKMHPCVVEALRIGVYQILFMDKVPVSAAVNESVKIVRAGKQERATGITNALLRAIARQWEAVEEPKTIEKLLPNGEKDVLFSCPSGVMHIFEESYGKEVTQKILDTINEQPPTFIRFNSLKTNADAFETILRKKDISFETVDFLEQAYCISPGSEKALRNLPEDMWYYQDLASQLCVKALDVEPGQLVMDVCAAPGGKSIGFAQQMNNQGRIVCTDLYPQKCDEMQERAKRMGITILETLPRDATQTCPKQWENQFDRVLCDVPCSGLGVILRRPEIRYHDLEKAKQLPTVQYAILEESSKMVKPGGFLQYSTCTLNKKENEEIVERFLEVHTEFVPRVLDLKEFFYAYSLTPHWQVTLFPHLYNTDGFFIAGFEKRK